MGKRKDKFWDYVEENDAGFRCGFCGFELARSTSVSRLKHHLARRGRGGIRICTEVPDDVREAAKLAIDTAEKTLQHGRSLSDHQAQNNTIASSSRRQSDGVENPVNGMEREATGVQGSGHVVEQWRNPANKDLIQPFARDTIAEGCRNDREQTIGADSTRFNATDEASTSLVRNDGVENLVNEVERGGVQGSAQVAEERRSSTSVAVGNLCENGNEEGLSPGGLDEFINMLWQPDHDDRSAPDCQMSSVEDTQRMITGQMGNSVENMNRPIASRFDGAETDIDRENDVGTMVQEQVIQPLGRVTTPDEPEPSAHQTISGDALLTTNLIGKTFQKNIHNIWDCLMKANVFTIGIYGKRGVGITSLAIHIKNRLLKIPNPFHCVYWVSVSQDFSICRLQTLVAKAAKIDLSNEDERSERATKLYEGLTGKKNSVLILDDLRESFDLTKVGIPVGEHGCKLILTSRLLEVCRQMNSGEDENNIIEVVPLSPNEAQKLFWDTLGCSGAFPPEITRLAKEIAKKCEGLPLALKTMAVTMKGVNDIKVWENASEVLKESEDVEVDMEVKVLRILKFSYNCLTRKQQDCFQFCAVYPGDCHIKRTELIECLVEQEIIGGRRSRNAKHEYGHCLLDELESAGLLEGSIDGEERYVKMRDLGRNTAVQIPRANSKSMVEAGKQLKELPDEENWKEDLVIVSLRDNNIKKIPSGHSPNCPNLSTLLLCNNRDLASISESFFEKLNGLKILDLSHTDIEELPDSVSKLVNLTSLLLRGCWRLNRVPSLGKLKELKKLDLSMTYIKGIPRDMELLSNLIHLDLCQTDEMEVFPSAILSRFSKLQYLDLGIKRVKIKEVAMLKKLEFVRCCFSDLQDWNNYIRSLEGLCRYCFYLAPDGAFSVKKEASELALQRENEVMIEKVCGFVVLPKDVHILLIRHCHELESLDGGFYFSLCHPTQLKQLKIWDCGRMEWLHDNLPESLEGLAIRNLWNLSLLLRNNSNINSAIFSNLKSFKICHCPGMKKLFPPQLLPNLCNLEELVVIECGNLVEIIGNGPESSVCSSPTPTSVDFNLPKLKVLFLYSLSELQRICIDGRNLICNSLQEITVEYCCKLKRMPISLPPSSLKKITTWPTEWWDSVDWRHRNEKDALGPLVEFSRLIPDDLGPLVEFV